MYQIHYDKPKNRIYIDIEGTMNEDEKRYYRQQLVDMISITIPGFTVCADLSKANEEVLLQSGEFQDIRAYSSEKGVYEAAQVIHPTMFEKHQIKPYTGLKNVFVQKQKVEEFLDRK